MKNILPEAKRFIDEYVNEDIPTIVHMLAYEVDRKKGETTNKDIVTIANKAMKRIKEIIEKRDRDIEKYRK